MGSVRLRVSFLVIAIILLAVAAPVWAQNATTGAVSGTVTDPTGAVVAGAKITATNAATGAVHTATTQENGGYIVPLLLPGDYVVEVSHNGFQTAKQGPVAVAVSGNTEMNFKLAVGQASQTIEVTGEAPLLEPANANTTTTLDAKAIQDLPNPGNDLTMLAQSVPGALLTKGAGGAASYIPATYNGLPGTGMNFLIDGAGFTNTFLAINQSGATDLSLGVNDVSEVSANTNSYSVDQGGGEAASVNYVSKHGGNQFHGNAMYQWNGRALNSYDFFVKAVPVAAGATLPKKPFDNVNNYAASFGGPIKKNKLFFFEDEEGTVIVLPEVLTTTLPTQAYETYAASQMAVGGCETSVNYFVPTAGAASGNCAASAATQPGVGNGNYLYLPPATGAGAPAGVNELPYMQNELALYKNITGGSGLQLSPLQQLGCNLLVNGTVDPSFNPQLAAGQKKGDANPLPSDTGCTNNAQFTGDNHTWESQSVTRVDWIPNQNNNLWFSFTYDDGLQATALSPINPIFNSVSAHVYHSATADWTRVITPNLVSDAIANISWLKAPFNYVNQNAEEAANPQAFSTPWAALGGSSLPSGRDVTNWALIDNINWVKDAHHIIFGVNFVRNLTTDRDFQGGAIPSVSASSFAEFDYGVSPSGTLSFPKSQIQPIRNYTLEFYAGDTWQLTRKLTLIYGVRTTTWSNLVDPQGYLGDPMDFEDMNHAVSNPLNKSIFASNTLWSSVPAAVLQPRAAFSYQLNANTLLKGGYGIFNDVLATSIVDTFAKNPPFDPTFIGGYGSASQGAIAPNKGPNGCAFSVNGGGAICGDYYDPGQALSVINAAKSANTGFQSAFSTGLTSCAAFATAQPTGTCVPVSSIAALPQSGFHPPYAEEWNLGIQEQIGRNTAIDANYVGNRSLHNSYTVDPNAYQTACSGCFAPFVYSTTGAAGDPDPRFSTVSQTRYDGYSTYNALQIGATERNFHGLTFTADYAWAHGLSTNTPFSDTSGLPFTYRDTAALPFNVFSINYTYPLPWKVQSKTLGEVFNGWQFSGATFAQTGPPFFVTGASNSASVFQSSGPTTTPYLVSGVSPWSINTPVTTATLTSGTAYANAAGTYQWFNPNAFESAYDSQTKKCINPTTNADLAVFSSAVCQFPLTEAAPFYGPGFEWTNLYLSKSFKIREGMQLRFDLSAYNLFNHPNLGVPNTTAPTPGQISTYVNAGTITKMANPATGLLGNGLGGDSAPRMFAFQGKIIF